MSKTTIAVTVLLILVAVASLFFLLNRPRRIIIDVAPPAEFPQQGFSHDSFEQLMQQFVTSDGRINYQHWHGDGDARAQLESYLAAVRDFSPINAPDRFAGLNDELAYWLYGYNAYVIYSVLENWPIGSVTDVKAPLELVRGLGFFYQQRYAFGGEFMNLVDVERKQILDRYRDPRIHFVLNCASDSCPVARPVLPTGEELEDLLARATVEFINDPSNVQVDHEAGALYLSSIFKWYEKDFVQDLRRSGVPSERGLLTYLLRYATGAQAADLKRAESYEIKFRDYNWDVNSAG